DLAAICDQDLLEHQPTGRARLTYPSLIDVLLEVVPARVARAGHALHLQRELARARGVEEGALVGDDALRVPVHERLVEGLHAVLHRAVADEVWNVQRFVEVADV